MAEGLNLPERPPQTRIRTTPGRQAEKVLYPPTGPGPFHGSVPGAAGPPGRCVRWLVIITLHRLWPLHSPMVEQRPRDVAEALQTLLRRQLATPTTRCEVRRFEGPPPLRRLRPLRGGLRRGRSSAMGAGSLTARFAHD